MAQHSNHPVDPMECHPMVQVPDQASSKRKPVRLGDFFAFPAHSTRQSCVGVTSVRRAPMHVVNTPQGPRLVQRITSIRSDDVYPTQPYNRKQPPAAIVEQRMPVKRQLQAPHTSHHNNYDFNLTLGGIQSILSPAGPPDELAEPMEKKNKVFKDPTVGRGYNLQKLAINKKRAATSTVVSNSILSSRIAIPDSPNIILSSKKPLQSMRNQMQLPLKSKKASNSTAVSAATNSAEFKERPLPTANTNTAAICNPMSQIEHLTELNSNCQLSLSSTASDPQVSIEPTHNLKCTSQLLEYVDNITPNKVNTSNMLREETTELTFYTQQLKVVEKGIIETGVKQKCCQDELSNVYAKQLELEAEAKKLDLEHREQQNYFMALCRNIAKLQCTQTNTKIIDTVQPLVHSVVVEKVPIVPQTQTVTEKVCKPLVPANSDKLIEKKFLQSALNTSKNTPTDTYKNFKSKENTTSVLVPCTLSKMDLGKRVLAEIQSTPNTPQTLLRRSLRILSSSKQMVDQSSEKIGGVILSASKNTLMREKSAGNMSSMGSSSTLQQNTETRSKVKEKSKLALHSASSTSKMPDYHQMLNTNDELDATVPVTMEPIEFYGNTSNNNEGSTALRRSQTFVLDKPNLSAAKKTNQMSAAKKRRSVIDYRQLQASFHGLLQTPMKTPISKSAKKNLCPKDTPSNISRRVQASLELLLDSSI